MEELMNISKWNEAYCNYYAESGKRPLELRMSPSAHNELLGFLSKLSLRNTSRLETFMGMEVIEDFDIPLGQWFMQ
jgi:hypothetical protein